MARPSVVRHATIAKSFKVHPMEEVIFNAYVDRHENQDDKEEIASRNAPSS